ncbi:MAG: wax ester/triacylglycerol synthase family O-acyltransferase [Caldimonas sp.]
MQTVSGLDGTFLHMETPETPQHVGALSRYVLPAGYEGDFYDDFRRELAKRLHLVPVFTRKLAPMPLQFANPVWVEDDQVDLDHHVQRLTLPRPGTQAQLEDCVGRLHSELLDRNRPLWQITVIDGLDNGDAAYYLKVHHATMDGQASVLMVQTLFDPTPKPRRIRHGQLPAAEHPGKAELAALALKHDAGQYLKLIRQLPDVVKTLAGLFGANARRTPRPSGAGDSFAPKTPLNVPITGQRGFAALSIPLHALKQLAAAHETKLNDVVLALCSGALRRYLKQHGGLPRKPLIAAMPISLREAGNAEYTTQVTMGLVNLNTHIADPVKRLRAIRDAALAAKQQAKAARGVTPTDFPSIGVPWLMQSMASLYGRSGVAGTMPNLANVVISNVPGPTTPLYAAGARMATYWPLSIVGHGQGLNITVMSYAGAMGFGFTTARSAIPDARELSAALLAALDELSAGARVAPVKRALAKAVAKKALKPSRKRPS